MWVESWSRVRYVGVVRSQDQVSDMWMRPGLGFRYVGVVWVKGQIRGFDQGQGSDIVRIMGKICGYGQCSICTVPLYGLGQICGCGQCQGSDIRLRSGS